MTEKQFDARVRASNEGYRRGAADIREHGIAFARETAHYRLRASLFWPSSAPGYDEGYDQAIALYDAAARAAARRAARPVVLVSPSEVD